MKGGPTFGSYVEYATMDDVIASIHKSTGRLSAVSPGNTVRMMLSSFMYIVKHSQFHVLAV